MSTTEPVMLQLDGLDAIHVENEQLGVYVSISKHWDGNPSGKLSVRIVAAFLNGVEPGRKADFSPEEHEFLPSEIAISDSGLFTAMHRHESAAGADIRTGLSVQLPSEFVAPVLDALMKITQLLEQQR